MRVIRSHRRHGNSIASLRRRALLAAVAGVPLLAAQARTAWALPNHLNIYTGAGTQNWTDPAGWSEGAPSAEDIVRVSSSGTLEIDSAAAANSITFGYGDNLTPTLNLKPGGSLLVPNAIIFGGTGAQANSNNVLATLNQTGGDISIPANRIMWMGFGGAAVWNMSGGTTTVGYPGFSSLGNLGISIGTGAGALAPTSTLNMTGGTINSDAVFELARNNAGGVLNMSGGTINIGTEFWIGQPGTTGGQATITHSGGAINLGYNHYGTNSYGNVLLGVGNAGKAANYTLSGTGALNVYRNLYIGGGQSTLTGFTGGEGNLTLNGGTVNIGDARQVSGASLYIGWSGGDGASKGNVTVNDGTMNFNLPNAAIVVGSYDGSAAPAVGQTATMNITGGQVLNPKGVLEIGRAGATGTLNLSGGLLSINSLRMLNPADNGNVRQFNFTGGTLEADSADSDYAITNAGGTFKPGGASTRVFKTTGGDGSYLHNSGTLSLDVSSAADYDALDLSASGVGAANLAGGTVNVATVGGFAPAFGATIPVITARTITDSATWNLPAVSAGNVWDKRISTDGANEVESLTVVRSSASTHTSGASWTSADWSAGTPNGVDASAKLGAGGGSINIDAPVTVGYLQLDGGSWTVGGASPLTVATSGGATGGIVAFGGTHTISAPVAFNANASIATQLKSTGVTLAGDVSGSSTVEKTGPGSLTLTSATSSFAGNWKISGGSLHIATDANLGAPAASLALSNAALNVSGAFDSSRAIVLSGANTLSTGGDSTLSGVISGPGGITKTDGNTLVLAAANTYAGATDVTAGTLRQGAANAVPSGSALTLPAGTSFDLNAFDASVGSIAGAGNISTGGANLTVGNDNTTTTYSGLVSGGGTFTKNGAGTLVFNRPEGATGGITPIDGNIVVNGGTLQFNALNQGTYDLPFSDITVNAGANLWLNGAVPNGGAVFSAIHGAGSVTVGSYLVALTAANDYTGGTNITGGAVAQLTDLGAVGPAGTPVDFKGSGARDNSYAGGIWFDIGDGVTPSAGTFSHPMSVEGYKLATVSARGNDITLDQPITGDGGIQFQSGGFSGSIIRLNAASTYKGVTTIDPALKVILGVDHALPANAIGLNGSLDLNGHAQTLGYLVSFGTPTIDLNGASLTIDSDIEPQFGGAWTGTMSGTGGVIKTGGGSQQFSLPAGAAATYTGGTIVDQGTLQILNNINALPVTGGVRVNAGGVLQLTTTAAGSSLDAGETVTYAGDISGAGEVQITTLEKVALSGNNTYSGGTRISNGWLVVNEDANLGAPTGKITFHWNGSNPGAILMFGGNVNSARDVAIENGTAFVDTNGFDATVGNIDATVLPPNASGLGSLNKIFGQGTLTANHVRANVATVSVGTLAMAASGGDAAGTSKVNSLVIAADARFDLKDNKLITNNAPGSADAAGTYDGLQREVQRAYNFTSWDQPGLMTSMPDAKNGLTTIGISTGKQIRGLSESDTALWGGQTITGASTLAMYTYAGDANLDGQIDAGDYGIIDNFVQIDGASGYGNGDFNYDGFIDAGDYGIIDNNIQAQTTAFPTGGSASSTGLSGVTAVPEPSSLGALALGASALLRRRRRQQRHPQRS